MEADQPTEIPCEDSEGNRYTVFERGAIIPDHNSENELLRPTWFIIRDGKEVTVQWDKDSETGRQCFTHPDGLQLFPLI